MSIKSSQRFRFSTDPSFLPSEYARKDRVKLEVPGLPRFEIKLVDDRASLVWEDITAPIITKGGSLIMGTTGTSPKSFVGRCRRTAKIDLLPGSFPATTSGSALFIGSLSRDIGQEFDITVNIELRSPASDENVEYAESFAATLTSQVPNNVCIYFPRTGQSLWSNEKLLSNASPYLSTSLKSGFAETGARDEIGARRDKSFALEGYEYDDSDVEEVWDDGEDKDPNESPQLADFKQINVTQATFRTYFNVLCWIGTGYIRFARLKSSERFPSLPPLVESSQEKPRAKSFAKASFLPLPASPKSVYRLAHLLELPELSKLALEDYKFQLTPQNAAHELYSDVASTYSEVRDAALEYVGDHLKEVLGSDSYKEIRAKASTDDGVNGLTGLLLCEKMMEKKAK